MTATSIAIVDPSLGRGNVVPLPAQADTLPFRGLSHREAIELELPAVPHLLRGAAERGSVGTLAGLPESFKSFLAMELALKVAGGGSSVLGLDVETHGPVGYWWQDDSKEAELTAQAGAGLLHARGDPAPLRGIANRPMARALRACSQDGYA